MKAYMLRKLQKQLKTKGPELKSDSRNDHFTLLIIFWAWATYLKQLLFTGLELRFWSLKPATLYSLEHIIFTGDRVCKFRFQVQSKRKISSEFMQRKRKKCLQHFFATDDQLSES